MVNHRMRINNISSLIIDRVHIESPIIISQAIEIFFKSLFIKLACQGVSLNWDYLIPDKIVDPATLVVPFSEEEIKSSVDSLPGEKSPSPDGFSLCFYHRFWQNLKDDIIEMFEQFYQAEEANTLRSIN